MRLAGQIGLILPILWIDCETYVVNHVVVDRGPDAQWLRRARYAADTLGVRLGIYTARWYWTGYMGDTVEFGDLALWTASYGPVPDIENVTLYGSWTMAHGHQWTTAPVDRDVFRREVAA